MKNRRIAISAFLLIAVLVMGIGFASLTDNLFIKGEAQLETSVSQPLFDSRVHFVENNGLTEGEGALVSGLVSTTGDVAVPNGLTEGVVIGTQDPDSATFYLYSLGKTGDYAIFSFVIRNESVENNAIITLDAGYPRISNDESNMFKLEYSVDNSVWVDATTATDTNSKITCNTNSYTQVFVRVTLLKSPVVNTSAAFNINLTATAEPVSSNVTPG